MHVTPGARTDAVAWDDARGWRVHVAATATDNRANERLCAFLAREVLRVPTADVTVKSGATSRQKVLKIALAAEVVDAALRAWRP